MIDVQEILAGEENLLQGMSKPFSASLQFTASFQVK